MHIDSLRQDPFIHHLIYGFMLLVGLLHYKNINLSRMKPLQRKHCKLCVEEYKLMMTMFVICFCILYQLLFLLETCKTTDVTTIQSLEEFMFCFKHYKDRHPQRVNMFLSNIFCR